MREDEFRRWLAERGERTTVRSISTIMSRCRRVVRLGHSLEGATASSTTGYHTIIEELERGASDILKPGADLKRISDLVNAVELYHEFAVSRAPTPRS